MPGLLVSTRFIDSAEFQNQEQDDNAHERAYHYLCDRVATQHYP